MHKFKKTSGVYIVGAAAILCMSSWTSAAAMPAQTSAAAPVRERFTNAEVIYDWVSNSRGEKLRTFVTRPKSAKGKVPVIFFVGWLSCDSMEYAKGKRTVLAH